MKKILFLNFILLCIAQIANAQYNFTPVTQLLTDSIESIGQSGKNCGLMIIQGDSIIYQKYFGSWNDTTYQPIASGSKIPSMTLIMKLIREGKLSPKDTVQKYLPSFKNKPIMTLHQLMNHSSGLPGVSPFISNNSLSLQQAVDSIGLITPMTSYAPGTAFQYGGVSMHVAGRIAEIVTGVRWDSLFQQKIAIPLGMVNTDYVGLGNTTNFRMAAGVGTTMPDYAKLLIMLLQYGNYNNVQIIDTLTIKMMQTDLTNNVPLISTPYSGDTLRENYRYGYGGWIEEKRNGFTTQFGSQGAFGFTPWIDRCRNIACVFFVRKSLGSIQPTHTKLRSLIEEIIPIKLKKPLITVQNNKLYSNYTIGNQWYYNDIQLQGQTNQSLVPNSSGNYSVRYTSEEGCETISDEIYYDFTEVESTLEENIISIYPNPASDVLYLGNKSNIGIRKIELITLLGNTILELNEAEISTTTKLDTRNLATGRYLLKVTDSKGRTVIQQVGVVK